MFVACPVEQEDDEFGTWEGSIKQMNRVFDKRISIVQTQMAKQISVIQD